MKKAPLLVLISFFSLTGRAQLTWEKFTAIKGITVEVPVKLDKVEMELFDLYAGGQGDSVQYSITALDFARLGIDTTELLGMIGSDAFEEEYIKGFLSSLEGSALLSKEKGMLGELHTLLLELDYVDGETGHSSRMSSYSVFAGNFVYNLTYNAVRPVAKDRARFFSSTKIGGPSGE